MKAACRLTVLTILLCLMLLVPPAAAQEPIVLRIDRTDADAFPSVSLLVTVRNGYGGPIAGLTPANFDVSEDATLQARPIQAVEPLVDPALPVTVLLAIDISGSMTGAKLRDAQEAARRFLDSLSAQDSAALIAFAGSIDLAGADPAREVDFTGDTAALNRSIDALRAGGATPLYDTAAKAVRWAAAQPAGNRAVLLFTDGKEERAQDGSGGSRIANDDTAIREANRAGIPVFTVGLGADADEGYLRRLALETGGAYQHAQDSAELAARFRAVSDLLKQQYRITYSSGLPADGQTHPVMVAVRVGESTASDKAEIGPLPLAPPPTPQPSEPPATATPDAPTPAPEPLEEPTAAGQVTTIGMNGTTSNPEPSARTGLFGIAPVWWLLIVGVVLAASGLGIFVLGSMGVIALGRKNRTGAGGMFRCLRCGAPLPAKNARCPSCGALQSYKEGM